MKWEDDVVLVAAAVKSRPARGARIEITDGGGYRAAGKSRPARGARIEIAVAGHNIAVDGRAP